MERLNLKHMGKLKCEICGQIYFLKNNRGDIVLILLFPFNIRSTDQVYNFIKVGKKEVFTTLLMKFKHVELKFIGNSICFIRGIGKIGDGKEFKISCYFMPKAFENMNELKFLNLLED